METETKKLQLVSEADIMAQVKQADRCCWGLANMIMALQYINCNSIETILHNFKKFGYNGQQIEAIARALRKLNFANKEMEKALRPCYKDNLLQPVTTGNLQMLLEDVIASSIGLTTEGKEATCKDYSLAFIPKGLVPAIKLAPGMSEIEWLADKVDKMCKEGREYLEKHDLMGNDIEVRIGKAEKAMQKKQKQKV